MMPARESAMLAEIDALRAELAQLRHHVARIGAGDIASPSIRRLAGAAAAEFGVTVEQLLSYRRMQRFVIPRQVVMHLAHTRLEHSLPRIGAALQRDHSTVFHGVRALAARLETDPWLAQRVERVWAAAQPPSPENPA